MRVLITGGAGFIGSHVADDLLAHGHQVRLLDCFDPQVHPAAIRPEWLPAAAELIEADVRDAGSLQPALDGVDAVVHLAARVGVGQSMYEMPAYVSANELGTAMLLQAMLAAGVRRLVVASSMSIYGEGLMLDASGGRCETAARSAEQLRCRDWELRAPDGSALTPVATPEDKRPQLASVYALNKYAQEQMCLIAGRAYGLEVTALRFFNVYGPRQALSNPYTGVLAIFASRLLNGRPPLIFEDGRQRRDFVHVRDAAVACRLALQTGAGAGQALNVGSGESISVAALAERLAAAMGRARVRPLITEQARAGDIRHCFADITRARHLLGFTPSVDLDSGLAELVDWLDRQRADDRSAVAIAELESRGLVA